MQADSVLKLTRLCHVIPVSYEQRGSRSRPEAILISTCALRVANETHSSMLSPLCTSHINWASASLWQTAFGCRRLPSSAAVLQ